MNQTAVLIAGADRKRLFELVGLFENQPRLQVQTRVTPENDHAILAGVASQPDILVLLLDEHWRETLNGLLSVSRSQRPELIVIADAHYSDVMQLAMQAGARDYLIWDQAGETLLPSLNGIAADLQSGRESRHGKLFAVINSKGGAGASFVAANLGHMLRASAQQERGADRPGFHILAAAGLLRHHAEEQPLRRAGDAVRRNRCDRVERLHDKPQERCGRAGQRERPDAGDLGNPYRSPASPGRVGAGLLRLCDRRHPAAYRAAGPAYSRACGQHRAGRYSRA